MKRLWLLLLVCVLVLAGCAGLNEQSARYADYAAFKTGKFASKLPSTLVPVSARDIRVTYNIDTTEIDAVFAFERADAEGMISPFRSPDQIRLHELEASGQVPPSQEVNPLFVRCTDWGVEYLQVNAMTHAHYWTSSDPKLRKIACVHEPARPSIST